MSALDKQTGGNHYKNFPIQPIEAIHKNGLDWFQGNITKYAWRHHFKNGAEDLKKVIHYAELALEMQYSLKPNELESVVDEVATPEERSANVLIEMIMQHPHRGIILKGITHRFISEGETSVSDFESNINEAVINHISVNEKSTMLDILLHT